MAKAAVVYWSGTGNTEAMAKAVLEGAKAAGADVQLFEVESFPVDQTEQFDAFALGCPAMGDEELEDTTFEPVLAKMEGALAGKKVVLFGSYGWGDGDWMNAWEERCANAGITLAAPSVIVNETPDDEGESKCRELGAVLA